MPDVPAALSGVKPDLHYVFVALAADGRAAHGIGQTDLVGAVALNGPRRACAAWVARVPKGG